MLGNSEKFSKNRDMFENGNVSNATQLGKENDLKADESLAWGTITNSDDSGRARTHEQREALIPQLRDQQEQALLVYAQLHEQRKQAEIAEKQRAEEAASLALIAKIQAEEALQQALLEEYGSEDQIARFSNANYK